jgi:predicted O-methyltransferase YrrM
MGGIFFDDPMKMISSLGKVQNSPALSQGDFYPMSYNSNPKTLELIRELIKLIRPKCVVETGVANGFSTRQILESFKEFELYDSRLFSFDIDPKVFTVELERNPQFNKVIIDSASSFLSAMHKIGSVDLFYHDSDHSYENQLLEYDAAWRLLSNDGVLISDDINWSNAFLDFCKKVNRTPLLLSDSGKFCGVISKSVY